ncbi:hypothetical protein V8C42DRAFT_4513 [Trichoderma barbatum]
MNSLLSRPGEYPLRRHSNATTRKRWVCLAAFLLAGGEASLNGDTKMAAYEISLLHSTQRAEISIRYDARNEEIEACSNTAVLNHEKYHTSAIVVHVPCRTCPSYIVCHTTPKIALSLVRFLLVSPGWEKPPITTTICIPPPTPITQTGKKREASLLRTGGWGLWASHLLQATGLVGSANSKPEPTSVPRLLPHRCDMSKCLYYIVYPLPSLGGHTRHQGGPRFFRPKASRYEIPRLAIFYFIFCAQKNWEKAGGLSGTLGGPRHSLEVRAPAFVTVPSDMLVAGALITIGPWQWRDWGERDLANARCLFSACAHTWGMGLDW